MTKPVPVLLLAVILFAAATVLTGEAAPAHHRTGLRFDFSDPERFSREWQFNGAMPMIPRTAFYLATEPSADDGRVLVVEANRSSGIIMSTPAVNLDQYPILHWRWRLVRPVKVAPGCREPDDQAGVVYIGDGNRLRQYCVAYRWEAKNAVSNEGKLMRYKGGLLLAKCFCLRNNNDADDGWVEEYRNVVVDFQKAFKRPPGNRFVLSVGGNSQYTKSNTRVEIDYIEFLPRTALPRK